ncbi:MAG: hypothetical protein CK424_01495 [Legionella sp.]|nr:MAG: hypothetical protein CK424_01495 [Legionella sp.]
MSNDRKEIYNKVVALKTAIDTATERATDPKNIHNKLLKPVDDITKTAATKLSKEIQTALDKWTADTKQNTSKGLIYTEHSGTRQNEIDKELVTACQTSVKKHHNNLMHDPGFWNQIKAAVNSFVSTFGVNPVFKIKLSPIATNKEKGVKHGETLQNEIKAIRDVKEAQDYKSEVTTPRPGRR